MKSLVIGLGEVGSAVLALIKEKYEAYGRDLEDLDVKNIKVLHICIPRSKDFIEIVNGYIDQYKPILTFNHSTVPIGTTRKLKGPAVHSPVRGSHPHLLNGLKRYIKYISYNDPLSMSLAAEYWEPLDSRYFLVEHTETTELAKALALCRYALNIAFADVQNDICKKYNLPYVQVVTEWEKTYNEGLEKIDLGHLKRPLMTPPNGKIGGHCVIPAVELINELYPHPMLDEILRIGA